MCRRCLGIQCACDVDMSCEIHAIVCWIQSVFGLVSGLLHPLEAYCRLLWALPWVSIKGVLEGTSCHELFRILAAEL